jgi:pyruvate dehydrogenase E1 component beta subunit
MAQKRIIEAINDALTEEMERDERVIVFGQDIEISMFGDTKGLLQRFGPARVRNTPISETLMSGMAVGAAAAGYRVVCHMMYANMFYTGFEGIANQAAKLPYMTAGQVKLPIVFFGLMGGGRSVGAQHSDSSHPLFMNLGGLKVVVPSMPADAKGLLKSAIRDDSPVVYLQPGGRGPERAEVPDGEFLTPLGVADIKRGGRHVTIVAIGSMVRRALAAAEKLGAEGIEAEVIDPRSLVPLDKTAILDSVRKTGHLVVVDEARLTCGAASEITAMVAEEGFSHLRRPPVRVAVPDVPMPFAPVLEREVMPNEDKIIRAVHRALGR